MRSIQNVVGAIILVTAGLSAQETADTIRFTYPVVTTTGTRLAEPWIAVPLAISRITVGEMSPGKGYGLDEALTGVPGVLAQSRYGNQDVRITIRGFGARGAGARSNAGTSRGIRVLVDGFPETEPDGRTSFDLVDLAGTGRLEVVRSNVSSVYGNASGGVISVSSMTDFRQPFAEVQSTLGSFGFRKETARLGTMLGMGRFFLSASNTNADGWREHSGSSQAIVNAGIVSPLGEKTDIGVYLTATSNLFRIPGPLSQEQFDSSARQSDSTFIKRDERRFNRLGRLGVSLSHTFDEHNGISSALFVTPKYIQRSERNRFRDFNRYHTGGNVVYRNETMFDDHIQSRFLAGMDEAYQDGAILFYNLTGPASSVIKGDRSNVIFMDKREGANNLGLFLQEEVMFNDRIKVLAGVRYDRISYYYEDYIAPSLNAEKNFGRFTPKAGLTYLFSPTQSVYANLGGGVEVPAGNETDPSPAFGQDTVTLINPLLEPIISTTVEIGTKHLLPLGGEEPFAWLTYDVALYWLTVHNDIVPYSGGAFYFTAGKTRRRGIEIGANLRFVDGLDIDAAVTASQNTYEEYLIDSVHYGRPGSFRDLSGNNAAGVPEFFYSLGVKYAPSFSTAFVGMNVQGIGKYFADDANQFTVIGYTIVNVWAGIRRLALGNWYVSGSLGVNNVLDAKYAASAWINPDLNAAGKPVFLESGIPRNIVGSIMIGLGF